MSIYGSARCLSAAIVLTLLATVVQPAHGAIELLSNGNFEAGALTGWSVSNQAGGSGTWYIDTPGTTTPLSGQTTIGNASGGSWYAVTDQTGPGTHVLLQSFAVPAAASSVSLSFQMFANDWDGGPIINPAGLTYAAGSNQHARVDILTAAALPFSTAAADIVGNYYLGVDAGVDPHAFTSYLFSLTATLAPGTTYQLRFAEVDNGGYYSMGIDNVSILAETASQVPEPTSLIVWSLLAMTLGSAGWWRRRKMAS
jgi:hypothetical protein